MRLKTSQQKKLADRNQNILERYQSRQTHHEPAAVFRPKPEMPHRALTCSKAVQSAILKTGKIAADRLFIIKPKAAGPSAKGGTRANLSLN